MKYKIIDIISILLYGSSILASILFGYLNHKDLVQVSKITIFLVLLVTILLWVLEGVKRKIRWNKKKIIIVISAYILSLVLLLLSHYFELYHLWFIGSISISAWIHPYLGVGIHFIFSILYSILQQINMEQFSYYFLLGAILCMIVPYLRKKKNVIYIFITGLCVQMSLFFVIENFTFRNWQALIFSCMVTWFLLIFIFIGLHMRYLDIKKDRTIHIKAKKQNLAINQTKDINETNDTEKMKLDRILDREYELIKQLSSFSPKLYLHSNEVSELSGRVVQQLGGNSRLAQAGGLYHEIGKISGSNYVLEGVKLAKEHHFPEKVIDIIRQHHVKTEKPHSLEAATVMLADSILSTIEYMKEKRPQEQIDTVDIIENIFELRLQKGMLDDSGVTTNAYLKMKKFFLENI